MSDRNPEISVIIPVYNAGEYLAPCIESVLGQTFTDFELLLIDDASTDGSLAVCQRYEAADPRIRVLPQAKNRGLSITRNVGIDAAKGCYLTFLDADDSLHPQFLERLYGAATSEDCQVAVSAFELVTPEEHMNPSMRSFSECRIRLFLPAEAVEDTLYQMSLNNSACGKLYDKKLFEEFRYRPIGYEDLDSFYRLFLMAERIAYVSAPMYFYTMNPGSYLHTFTPERAVVLDVTERIVAYMEANHPELLPAAHDRALSAAFNIFNLMAANNCMMPEIADRCKATIRRYRRESLFNRRVRLKNKLGIMVTYLGGFVLLKAFARRFQK